jgi:hypothetical protein
MRSLDIRTVRDETQITVSGLAQITVNGEDVLTIDLANPGLQIVQEEGRLTVQLHPRLAYTAPEERASVAAELGLVPFRYIQRESNVRTGE